MSRQVDSGIVENFFRRDGRLNRLRYFKRILLLFAVEMIIVLAIVIVSTNELDEFSQGGLIAFKVVCIVSMIPFTCLMIRRLHDMNIGEMPAYIFFALNVLLVLMFDKNVMKVEPSLFENTLNVLISVISLCILFWPGTNGVNRYGSDPTR